MTPGAPTISQDLEFHARVVPLSWTTTDVPLVAGAVLLTFPLVAALIGVFTAMIVALAAGILVSIGCMSLRKTIGASYFFDGLCMLGMQSDERGILGVNRQIRVFTAEPLPEWSGFRGARRDLGTVDRHDLAFPIFGSGPAVSRSGGMNDRVVSAGVSVRLDQGDPVGRTLGRRRRL